MNNNHVLSSFSNNIKFADRWRYGCFKFLIINDFFLSTMLLRLSINEMFKPSSRDF